MFYLFRLDLFTLYCFMDCVYFSIYSSENFFIVIFTKNEVECYIQKIQFVEPLCNISRTCLHYSKISPIAMYWWILTTKIRFKRKFNNNVSSTLVQEYKGINSHSNLKLMRLKRYLNDLWRIDFKNWPATYRH